MPKRKAIGPVENSSDGEEEEFYSFPPTPIQSAPSKPTFYNNLHIPSSVKRNISSGPGGSFGIGGGGGSFMQKATQGTKPFFGLSTSNQSPLKPTVVTTSTGPVAAKKPRSQEFLRNMKDLNKAFATSVRKSVSKNPSHSVIPLVKDYLYHSRVLMEQLKKGDNPGELVNGVDSPSRSFKSLGEFFDDFEQRFTEQSCSRESRNNSGESCLRSALTNSDNSSTLSSATSGASSSSFNSNASPSPTKPTAAAAADNLIKSVNSFPTFDASPFKPTPFTMGTSKTSTNLDIKAKEVTSFVPSSSPIAAAAASPLQKFKPATTLSSAATASTSSPAKPAGVFSGFSFFTSPTPGNPSLKFGSTSATVTSEKPEEKNNDEDDAEDEEPPKVEVTQVTEDDAVYSIRCKVFGVVDGKVKDKGVGMLYVKKIEGGKHQIVVRADNNLGTVILNILLQKSLPLDKNGKNTIMTVDLQGNNKKAMPIILKVKTEENATELLGKLKEFQQAS